jgi:hypothetical protein
MTDRDKGGLLIANHLQVLSLHVKEKKLEIPRRM